MAAEVRSAVDLMATVSVSWGAKKGEVGGGEAIEERSAVDLTPERGDGVQEAVLLMMVAAFRS
ncbi:hypothetical protein E2562_037240 [Oryza meyeriana var. granulata]|uniref:Uncharacterized protein n=1 Tax=Oryza meyeriana var. granulata TaxID=110450 RepID=A0A6G1CLP0_9ORYZ|nr:hypothetical protein E2562_037240 [Oryza meyeriana var. granulata]